MINHARIICNKLLSTTWMSKEGTHSILKELDLQDKQIEQ